MFRGFRPFLIYGARLLSTRDAAPIFFMDINKSEPPVIFPRSILQAIIHSNVLGVQATIFFWIIDNSWANGGDWTRRCGIREMCRILNIQLSSGCNAANSLLKLNIILRSPDKRWAIQKDLSKFADHKRYAKNSPTEKQHIPADIRWAVWERDNFTCRKCGGRQNLAVDHITAESQGGTLSLDNLQTLCNNCNRKKGNHGKPTT